MYAYLEDNRAHAVRQCETYLLSTAEGSMIESDCSSAGIPEMLTILWEDRGSTYKPGK